MRLKCLHPVILINPVSIHASVKDATVPLVSEYTGKSVSIHASVKDATAGPIMGTPTAMVSIHASVKDATPCL